jgi:hypothetical protein
MNTLINDLIDGKLSLSKLLTSFLNPDAFDLVWSASETSASELVSNFQFFLQNCFNIESSWFVFSTTAGIMFGYNARLSRRWPGLIRFEKLFVEKYTYRNVFFRIWPEDLSFYYDPLAERNIKFMILELEVFAGFITID